MISNTLAWIIIQIQNLQVCGFSPQNLVSDNIAMAKITKTIVFKTESKELERFDMTIDEAAAEMCDEAVNRVNAILQQHYNERQKLSDRPFGIALFQLSMALLNAEKRLEYNSASLDDYLKEHQQD